MTNQSILIVLSEVLAVWWWGMYVYSRRQASAAKLAEEAKYTAWDAAYKKAVKEGKTEYYALMDAVKAVGGGPRIFKVWEDTYNAAVEKGMRKYSAGLKATAAARKAAHS